MFGSKRLGWKLAGTLALLAALGMVCAWRGRSVNPDIWRCVARPNLWDGSGVRFQGTVEEVTQEGFRCRTSLAPVFVRGGDVPAEGDIVEVAGVFHAEGPHVKVRRMRTIPPDAAWRPLLNLVSLLVLVGVILNFLRHFAFRPQALQAEGTD